MSLNLANVKVPTIFIWVAFAVIRVGDIMQWKGEQWGHYAMFNQSHPFISRLPRRGMEVKPCDLVLFEDV